MILLVDIGNSRIKWVCLDESSLDAVGDTIHCQTSIDAFHVIGEALPSDISQVMATNVAGKSHELALVSVCTERWGISPEFVTPDKQEHGISSVYSDPSKLGADRWVALIAAHRLEKGAFAVIDAGTTVTLDMVNANGQHLGGLIMAGPDLVYSALNNETGNIGKINLTPDVSLGLEILGSNTKMAVANGTMLSIASAVDRALSTVSAEIRESPTVYITGGNALILSSWLETRAQYRPNLVLEGLTFIVAEN